MNEQVLDALRTVIDPELGLNIVDLGLVYSAEANDGQVQVAMTMTTPACPLHSYITSQVEAAIWRSVSGVRAVSIQLVWSPPWKPEMMSEAAKEMMHWAR